MTPTKKARMTGLINSMPMRRVLLGESSVAFLPKRILLSFAGSLPAMRAQETSNK